REWAIPTGTAVGMTAMIIRQDPTIFSEPFVFQPERWLSLDAAQLRMYVLPFSKGMRPCLGMHLVQAEIYLALAAIFRRF
ncbi:putative cytochrome P450, partial [Zopfia rhizophila CBS 207.26]